MNSFPLRPELLRELHQPRKLATARLAIFILLYVVSGAAAYELVKSNAGTRWVYLLATPFYLLAAGSLHGISLFTHEAVHGVLSRNRLLNCSLGAVCAWPVLQNFSAYRVLHLRHHDHLGLVGDPDHYQNYTRWSWMVFSMNWGRLLLGYPAYIVAIPVLGFRNGRARERLWIFVEVLSVVAIVTAVLLSSVPRNLLINAWLIPMLLINTMVNIRGMSQHTLLEHHSDQVLGTRSILTNRVVAFFMCNENFHLEHHLYPGVPWYHLPRLHQALKDDLTARGASYIPSYFSFVRSFIAGSFHRSPLGRYGR